MRCRISLGQWRIGAAAVLGVLTLALSGVAQAAPVQLAFIVDGSSSINDSAPAFEWSTLRSQTADAIRGINTDGSVELTVVKFGFQAFVEVAPTIVTAGNRESLASQVENMIRPTTALGPNALAILSEPTIAAQLPPEWDISSGQIEGGTNFWDAINLTTTTVFNSAPFVEEPLQLFNMLTDGNPTVGDILLPLVLADDFPENPTLLDLLALAGTLGAIEPEAAAIDARNAAIAAGVDLLSFEAIGFSPLELAFLINELAFPGPGVQVDGPPFNFPNDQGFVVPIAGFDEVLAALQAKCSALGACEASVPEPALAPLLVLIVLGAVAARRARAA